MAGFSDYKLSFDKELLLEFVLAFSRFEYSLKRAGFLKSSREAIPDWESFAGTMQGQLEFADPSLREAVQTLESAPPRKQVRTAEGQLGWQETSKSDGEAREAFLLRMVRIVRNNLFHGGKFPHPIGPVVDPARDAKLIAASLCVLAECRRVAPRVDMFFREAA